MFGDKARIIILLSLVFVLAFCLRIYKVDSAPSGSLVDEASFGYNAYSILQTGRDEHGVAYPMVFRAFGDQKLPAYAYSLVPSIKLFGLNNLGVRFPSVLAGSLLSVVLFLLFLKLGFNKYLSFIGGVISATSPWSIILSRFGYESNFGLLFLSLGILLSLNQQKKAFALFGGIFFGLTFYSYVAYRLITPCILLTLLLIFRRKKLLLDQQGSILLATFIISIIPLIPTIFTNQGMARFNQISIFSDSGKVLEINENRLLCTENLPQLICYANANKPLSYGKTILYRYIQTFSPEYLFLTGETNLEFLKVGNHGQFPIMLLPFYLMGLAYFAARTIERTLTKNELFIVLGLIITPLPALLSGDPQKVRLSALFPFVIILIVQGILQIELYAKKLFKPYIYYFSLTFFLLIFSLFFMINFLFIHIKKNEMGYGVYIPKLMTYLGDQDKKTQIYIRYIEEAIMYYAYVNKVDPLVYQKSAVLKNTDKVGFAHAKDLENIHVTDQPVNIVYCDIKRKGIKALYVTNENLEKSIGNSKKIITSENGVYKLMFVYDLNTIKSDAIKCE